MTATITALVIPVDGEPRTEQLTPDTAEVYAEIVGGYIEASFGDTSTGERATFYSNADSIAENLPLNIVATALWHRLNPDAHRNQLRGAVIAVGANRCDDADAPVLVTRLARVLHWQLTRGTK
ncbi:MAG: hypothetical protein WAV90_00250 [Gordonia amarae]